MLHAFGSESENKKPDAGASIAAVREPRASFDFDAAANYGSDHLADGPPLAARQASGSNQAALKRLPFSFMPVSSNQSRLQMLERKQDCACGGQCEGCKAKASPSLNFYGDLEDDAFAFAPDVRNPPAPLPDYLQTAITCKDLCDRAYADPALNTGGGGIVCEKGVKCACVFDVPPLKRGQCPELDHIVQTHENRHLPETDCPATAPLSRLGPKPGVDLIAVECTHRKESIAELDAVIPKATGTCKTGMQTIRDGLAAWVKANCP